MLTIHSEIISNLQRGHSQIVTVRNAAGATKDILTLAPGGIADGRGIAAAFALGAAGVQIGSAYLDRKSVV